MWMKLRQDMARYIHYHSFVDLDKALCDHFQVARAHHSHVTFADLAGRHGTDPKGGPRK